MSASRRDNRQEQELRAIIDDIPGNDRCADCEAVSPRWASYSLGVFLCTRCASIHRKNSDVSKVKSISLDTWTPEQIQKMREVGNTISNYKYNPLREWPMQDDDSTMERFIRDKYERQMFMSQRETANFTPVKSAMKGSAQPIEAGKSSSAAIKYSKELDQLREMGFTDRARNVDVLKQVMGDVTSATEKLISLESSGPQSAAKKHEKLRVRFTADTIGGEEQTPQVQAANPFDMWAQAGSAGGQQTFQNPFSSIPPSMYNNQNFVQNVQAQSQQQNAPFLGYQMTGQDAQQQQYIQPAVPLRSQLTGGQPLRPQLTAPPAEPPQQALQPLRHQLTGRPAPPPPEPSFPSHQESNAAYQQSYQAPQAQNVFAQTTGSQRPPQMNAQYPFASHNAINPQTYQSQYQSQPQQGQQPSQQPFQSGDSYQSQNVFRPSSTQPTSQSVQALTPQLTGLRPKFKPTVDLSAPFGYNTQSQNTQQTGQSQFQISSPQVTGQGLNNSVAQGGNHYQKSSPQTTGQYPAAFPQGSYAAQSPFQSGNENARQEIQAQSTNQGQFRPPSSQPQGAPGNDVFGSGFTGPLRAQLTGMLQPEQSFVTNLGTQQNSQSSQYAGRPFQAQFTGASPSQQSPQITGATYGSSSQYRPQQTQQPLYAQNTGNMPNRIYAQSTGGQGFNPSLQQPTQTPSFQQPQGIFTQQQPFQQQQPSQQQQPFQRQQQHQPPPQSNNFQQQQQYNRPFQPQATGYQQSQQQQAPYGNQGMNPAKPFDKAGIMSLYGMQQQQQPQYQSPQPIQQQYTNVYGQQNGYQQQGYNGYQ